MKHYNPDQPLISLHVPKCAGQSFRQLLEQWFGNRFFIHYYQQYNALPPKHELKPGICIHGHFNRARGFGVQDYYPQAQQFITILRDPLDMAISNYFFWKTKARNRQLKLGIITPGSEHDYRDINNFFQKRPRSHLLDFLPLGLTVENVNIWLKQHFVWIGLNENLDRTLPVLAQRLGFESVSMPRINTSQRDEELAPAIRDQFVVTNSLEFRIYHHLANESERGSI